jgi:hypothetical protein
MPPFPIPESISPILHMLLRRDDAKPNDSNSALTTTTTAAVQSTSSVSSAANTASVSASPTAIPEHHGGTSGWLIAIIIIVVFAALGAGAFFVYKKFLGKHTPASAGFSHGGPLDSIKGWFTATSYKLRNPRNRQAGAGFEGISAGAAGMGTRDDAWDTRVHDDEEYGIVGGRSAPGDGYEMGRFSSEYKGAGATGNTTGGRYQDESGRHHDEHNDGRGRRPMPVENPFGDEHATAAGLGPGGSSLRSISPRPMLAVDTHGVSQGGSRQGSPTRKSVFREEMSAS